MRIFEQKYNYVINFSEFKIFRRIFLLLDYIALAHYPVQRHESESPI